MTGNPGYRFIMIPAAVLTIFLLGGCGSGGGGGAAPAGGGNDGGGSGGGTNTDTTPPVLSIIYPETGTSMSESIFRSESFYIQFGYLDANLMDDTTISVSFQMDNDPAQDVSSYFSPINSENIKSKSDFYIFTRSLFDMPTNVVTRVMKVTISVKDKYGNAGSSAAQFTVLPVGPPLRVSGD